MTERLAQIAPVFLDDAIAHWAEVAPARPAVHWQGRSYSYAELAEDVALLAVTLTTQGIGIGHRVGIAMAKSYHALVASFAILRANAAYIPLDPAAPMARVHSIVADCGIECVLTDKLRTASWTQGGAATVYDVSAGEWASRTAISPRLERERHADDLAYILYTSGSTGSPKGIAHSHRSSMAYATMAADLCALTPHDRVSHHTPLHFDMSIFDVFSTTCAGASIVVVSEMHAKMPASLSKLIADAKVSVWYSVPHALIQMNARGALDQRNLSSLRLVMFAGEKMPIGQLQSFARWVPQATFINAYGPTETNACTSFAVSASDIAALDTVPIGRPESGVHAHVQMDDEGAVEGELLIAGDQVMLGYWHDIVAGRDSLKPLVGADGVSRATYATGDIVRYEGEDLVLVGRADRQVKLRGFRVELDEVEAVIAAIAGVAEAAVVVDEGGETLRAFVGLAPKTSLTSKAIACHCAQHLPPYSVPQQINILSDLIRTSTGKINRTALAELAHEEH